MVYTRYYSKINTFINNFTIVSENSERWICFYSSERIGQITYHTLVDNFCEIYTLYTTKNSAGVLEVVNKQDSTSDKVYINLHTNELIFAPKDSTLIALPDFAIDVLQTTGSSVGRETLRRIANAYSEKKIALAQTPASGGYTYFGNVNYVI